MRPAGTTSSNVKLHNLSAILLALLQQEQISRVNLAQLVGVSAATITNLVAELLAQGVVAEDGTVLENEQRSVGRPQRSLQLVPDARFAVGINIEVGTVNLTLTDLLARPLETHTLDHRIGEGAIDVLSQLLPLVKDMIARHGIAHENIVGVGVGASGLVDPYTGVNVTSPNLGWRDVPIREFLVRQLKLPICVDNNVRAMALGESLFGTAKGVHALAFVYGRIGVGAGLVVGGRTHRGAAAGAGEIGHTTIKLHDGDECHCGNTGCLETLVSESRIIQLAKELTPDGPITTIDQVFAAARSGDAAMLNMLEERACYLGVALANLVNVFNPELIVLDGTFAREQDLLLPTIEATMRQRAFGGLGNQVRLEATSFGDHAGAIGAAALALDYFFYRPQNYTLQPLEVMT